MAIGESAGLLFRIKADGSDAKRELNSVKGEIGGLGGAMNALGGPAGIATAALAAIGTVAVATAAGIFRLTVAAAEYGSAIFDASEKTGLGAETLSALKYAADTSGSSLEAITGSIAKFNVLIGEANQGNEKANKTLEQYGITARTTDEALAQAIKTVAQMTDTDRQAAAAKALFKDRTAEILPVIKSFSGDLPGLIAKLRELGLVMSDEDARAADAFGDTLDTLKMQAAATGRAFATGLMPDVTDAMSAISGAMGSNKELAQAWGAEVGSTVRGVGEAYLWLESAGKGALAGLDYALGTNLANTGSWANAVISSLGAVGAAWYALNRLGDAAKRAQAQQEADAWGNVAVAIGDQYVNAPVNTMPGFRPSGGGGGTAKGGGGKGGADDADRQRQEELRKLRADHQQRLESYKAHLDETEAALKLSLSQKLIDETAFTKAVGELDLKALLFEKQLNEDLLKSNLLNDEEIKELKNKQLVLDKRIGKERKDIAREVFLVIKKQVEEETKAFEEAEKKRRAEMRKTANEKARLEVDSSGGLQDRKRFVNETYLGILGDSVLSIRDQYGDLEDMINPLIPLFEMAGAAVNQFAAGVGQLLQNLILTGTAGPQAMRKLIASTLAGFAAQAAQLAIMETAYGIAALTPWGAAIYGPAAPHFKAAAMFAIAAAVTGLAGRAIAGNAFNQATGGGGTGGGAGGGNSSDRDPNAFGERFRGFGDRDNPFTRHISLALDRLTQVTAMAEETNNALYTRITSLPADEILVMGAERDPSIIGRSNERYLEESGGRGTERLMRRTGFAT